MKSVLTARARREVRRGLIPADVRTRCLKAINLLRALLRRTRQSPPRYSRSAPSPQQALDVFKGHWISALPGPLATFDAGRLPLFADPALKWGLEQMGGAARKHILELGPLEGLHTWMLLENGAASITCIEAHPQAYLRCLVIKELLSLDRARFLHGDFVAFLREKRDAKFDVGIASGVLYHLEDPVELLGRLSLACDTVYLWTHYFDEPTIRRLPAIASRFSAARPHVTMGFSHTLHPFKYGPDLMTPLFCGGASPRVNWLSRGDILGALRHFGFRVVSIGFEDLEHVHGPAFALVAERDSSKSAQSSGAVADLRR